MSVLYCDCDFGGSKDPARECECEKRIRELEAELAEIRGTWYSPDAFLPMKARAEKAEAAFRAEHEVPILVAALAEIERLRAERNREMPETLFGLYSEMQDCLVYIKQLLSEVERTRVASPPPGVAEAEELVRRSRAAARTAYDETIFREASLRKKAEARVAEVENAWANHCLEFHSGGREPVEREPREELHSAEASWLAEEIRRKARQYDHVPPESGEPVERECGT